MSAPPLISWQLPTPGVVLTTPLVVDEPTGYVPHGATAWRILDGPWRPLEELPRGWEAGRRRRRGELPPPDYWKGYTPDPDALKEIDEE